MFLLRSAGDGQVYNRHFLPLQRSDRQKMQVHLHGDVLAINNNQINIQAQITLPDENNKAQPRL